LIPTLFANYKYFHRICDKQSLCRPREKKSKSKLSNCSRKPFVETRYAFVEKENEQDSNGNVHTRRDGIAIHLRTLNAAIGVRICLCTNSNNTRHYQ
jgi:hypothetical protein